MKTFKDLEFHTHEAFPTIKKHAVLTLNADYEISVIYGGVIQGYEAAISLHGELLHDEIRGGYDEEGITYLMKEFQKEQKK